MAFLDALCVQDISDTENDPGHGRTVGTGLIIGNVEGVPSGLYRITL